MGIGVVELRQYTLRPGRRDELIDLFDREFVESQEACGITVLGQFRDLDDPDRFVWLRGFADLAGRHAGLTAFYGGPVWAEHRDAANDTMLDSDDVLLLRPHKDFRPPPAGSLIAVTVYPAGIEPEPIGREIATLRTEHARNTFPALPVREADVVVRIAAVDDGEPRCPAAVRDLRLRPTAGSRLR